MTQRFSGAEEKAITLLGQGLAPSVVASAVGLSESRISQLLSDEEFSKEVVTLKYNALQAHSERDNKLDTLEDGLIGKLEKSIPLMFRPMEILRALQVVNAAKRRGQSAPTNLTQQAVIVNLVMPAKIVNKFTVGSNNQVIQTGNDEVGMQDLITMQSGTLLRKFTEEKVEALKERVRTLTTPPQQSALESSHETNPGENTEQTINSS